MKIIVVTNNYPRKNALNNGVFIHQQVKALRELGVECHVLLLHNWYPPLGLQNLHPYWEEGYDDRSEFFEEYEGVPIHAVPMFVRMPGRLFKDNYYDRAARSIIKYVKGNRELSDADWLYAHFLTDNGYIAAKVKDTLGMKLAAIARGDDIHAWPKEHPALVGNLRYVFDKVNLLLANSGNLAHDTEQWMEAGKKKKVSVVYNGIDHDRYRPATNGDEKKRLRERFGLVDDKRYMLCVATPVALKGWIELLDAVKASGERFDGWELLMVAPPRNNKDAIDLPKESADRGISDKTRYMGAVPPDELTALLKAVDAFVLPSHNEGMSNAVLEAMASGVPCIATEVGGHNEVIENGVSGLLIPPKDVAALTAAINTMTGDATPRERMGEEARKRMMKLGDYRQNSGKLLELLKGS